MKLTKLNTDKLTYDIIKEVYKKHNYTFFEGAYNLNVCAIRNTNRDKSRDEFDDVLLLVFEDENQNKRIEEYKVTTDPGLPELLDPSFSIAKTEGTAIIAPGQYRGSHALGYHGTGAFRHPAAVQTGAVSIYRDNNRDKTLDYINRKDEVRWAGLNIHGRGLYNVMKVVGRYSAGCIVFYYDKELRQFIKLIRIQERFGFGTSISLTLFTENSVIGALTSN